MHTPPPSSTSPRAPLNELICTGGHHLVHALLLEVRPLCEHSRSLYSGVSTDWSTNVPGASPCKLIPAIVPFLTQPATALLNAYPAVSATACTVASGGPIPRALSGVLLNPAAVELCLKASACAGNLQAMITLLEGVPSLAALATSGMGQLATLAAYGGHMHVLEWLEQYKHGLYKATPPRVTRW